MKSLNTFWIFSCGLWLCHIRTQHTYTYRNDTTSSLAHVHIIIVSDIWCALRYMYMHAAQNSAHSIALCLYWICVIFIMHVSTNRFMRIIWILRINTVGFFVVPNDYFRWKSLWFSYFLDIMWSHDLVMTKNKTATTNS